MSLMRASLTEQISEPTYNQLQTYYEVRKSELFGTPQRSFFHIYYARDGRTPPEDTEAYVRDLNTGAVSGGQGDFFPGGGRFTGYSYRQIAGVFGGEVPDAVFRAPLGLWGGPFSSRYGTHFLFVESEGVSEAPPFEQAESWLRDDYLLTESLRVQQQAIDELKQDYRIVRQDGSPAE